MKKIEWEKIYKKKKTKPVRCQLIPVRSAVIKEIDGYKE